MTQKNFIYQAPLQGLTDSDYCAAHASILGGVDQYFTPYVAVENDGNVKKSHRREIEAFSNMEHIVPQILPANEDELRSLLSFLSSYSFQSVNINAGCPYPMVMNKGRGASFILKSDQLIDFIRLIHCEFNLKVSVKTRLGIDRPDEIFHFLEKLPVENVSEVIIHARTADQMYKGKVQIDAFKEIVKNFSHFQLVYNGDIDSVSSFLKIKNELPDIDFWMLGRGILKNPILPVLIKKELGEFKGSTSNLLEIFFLNLVDRILDSSHDKHHAMNRILQASEYFMDSYCEGSKMKKALKRSKITEEMRFIIQKYDLKLE